MQQRELRYPPSPYRPHSADTIAYRDHWDLAWKHLGTLDSRYILNYESGLRGASRHGYRDGLLAKWSYLQKLEAFGRDMARRDDVESREQLRREAQSDRPY